MISYAGYRTGFPFPFKKLAEDGEPVSLWDKSTLFSGVPSKSSAASIKVVGEGTANPFGFSLQELAELYWRLKSCQLNFSFTYFQNTDLEGDDYDFTQEWLVTSAYSTRTYSRKLQPSSYTSGPRDDIEHESQLVIPITNPITRADFFYVGDEGYSTNMGYGNRVSISGSSSGVVLGWHDIQTDFSDTWIGPDGLYYPGFSIYISIGSDFGQPGLPSFAYIWSGAAQDATNLVTLPIQILDFTGTYYMYLFGTGSPDPSDYASGTIELAALEYFPYGGKWNTSTGAPA